VIGLELIVEGIEGERALWKHTQAQADFVLRLFWWHVCVCQPNDLYHSPCRLYYYRYEPKSLPSSPYHASLHVKFSYNHNL